LPSERSARTSERRRVRNRQTRRATRTIVAGATTSLRQDGPEEAQPAIQQALRALDRAVRKGILHRNNAARRKSRLMAKVNAAQNAT
jgi:small subunit ribosomal protein S20